MKLTEKLYNGQLMPGCGFDSLLSLLPATIYHLILSERVHLYVHHCLTGRSYSLTACL